MTPGFFAEYYSHPVWCLNSIFTGVDPASIHHREQLIGTIRSLHVMSVVDMGGGYGVFLKMLKDRLPELRLVLCEPYVTDMTERQLAQKNIAVSREVPAGADAYVFIDVLEHLVEPLSYLHSVLGAAQKGSYFIFGNCFYPVIKCHLPSTFYLRRAFGLASRMMGLRYVCNVEGAEYIQVYQLDRRCRLHPRVVALVARVASLCHRVYVGSVGLARRLAALR